MLTIITFFIWVFCVFGTAISQEFKLQYLVQAFVIVGIASFIGFLCSLGE